MPLSELLNIVLLGSKSAVKLRLALIHLKEDAYDPDLDKSDQYQWSVELDGQRSTMDLLCLTNHEENNNGLRDEFLRFGDAFVVCYDSTNDNDDCGCLGDVEKRVRYVNELFDEEEFPLPLRVVSIDTVDKNWTENEISLREKLGIKEDDWVSVQPDNPNRVKRVHSMEAAFLPILEKVRARRAALRESEQRSSRRGSKIGDFLRPISPSVVGRRASITMGKVFRNLTPSRRSEGEGDSALSPGQLNPGVTGRRRRSFAIPLPFSGGRSRSNSQSACAKSGIQASGFDTAGRRLSIGVVNADGNNEEEEDRDYIAEALASENEFSERDGNSNSNGNQDSFVPFVVASPQ